MFHSIIQIQPKVNHQFKTSLLRFENADNPLFYAVLYGLMFIKSKQQQNFQVENAEKIIGRDLLIKLKTIEKSTMLDFSILGFFDRCKTINEVLSEIGFF